MGGSHVSSDVSLVWQGLRGNYDFSPTGKHKENKSEILGKSVPDTHGPTSAFYFISFAVLM